MTADERVDVKLREIKHVLVQMISLSKLGRLKLGEAQQAYQDVDGDLSKVRPIPGSAGESMLGVIEPGWSAVMPRQNACGLEIASFVLWSHMLCPEAVRGVALQGTTSQEQCCRSPRDCSAMPISRERFLITRRILFSRLMRPGSTWPSYSLDRQGKQAQLGLLAAKRKDLAGSQL